MKRLVTILVVFLAAPAGAGVHEDVGFTRLKTELGARLPTGKGVSVAQVESSMEVQHNGRKILTWMPDGQLRDLRSTPLVDYSHAPEGAYSGHASAVAKRILGRGRNQGMASALDQLIVYSVSGWLGDDFLRTSASSPPRVGPVRLINHSWAASSGRSQVLRRSDWLTDHDEIIQVVGVRNADGKVNHSLMAAAVNAIVVGRSDGKHSVGTPAIDTIYRGGRTRPHLVAPLKTGSAAAPTVTSAVSLLLETAGDPSLSTRPASARNRNGEKIYDAGRSEVIRAVLMAAADRETDNSSHGNIVSYRDSSAHRSNNGLDTRYGAGQLNIYNAWQILSAGEQEQDIGFCGFDYEPGLIRSVDDVAPKESKRYTLPEVSSATRLTATVSWNLLFPHGTATRFDASAVLNDLDLSLYEISGDAEHLLQAASSRIDTTETIDTILLPGQRYELVVSRIDEGSVMQDYAIAWQMIGQGLAR